MLYLQHEQVKIVIVKDILSGMSFFIVRPRGRKERKENGLHYKRL